MIAISLANEEDEEIRVDNVRIYICNTHEGLISWVIKLVLNSNSVP